MQRMFNLSKWANHDVSQLLVLKGEGLRLIELEVLATHHTVVRVLLPDDTPRILWAGQGRERVVFNGEGDVHIVVETDGEFAFFTNDGDTQHRVSDALTYRKYHERRPSSPELDWVLEQAERRAMLRMGAILQERDRHEAAMARVRKEAEREKPPANTGGTAGDETGQQSASDAGKAGTAGVGVQPAT